MDKLRAFGAFLMLCISMSVLGNSKLAVSVMPTKLGLKDGAIKNFSPCVLTGTPEELDLEFTDKLTQPLKKVIGLLTNMDIVEKSIEATQAKSKLATEAKKKEETEIKAYSEKIKKVETLFSEKRTILLSRLYASF